MKKRQIMRLATCVLAGCVFSFAQDAYGVVASSKALGMGGATVALPQDSLTQVYNPASVVEVPCQFDIGLNVRAYKKELVLRDRGAGTPIPEEGTFSAGKGAYLFPEFGIVLHPYCNWGLGFAVYNEDFIRTDYGRPMSDFASTTGNTPVVGQTNLRYHWNVEALKASVAYCFSRSHSIGFSLDFYAARFRLDGLERFEESGNEVTRVSGHFHNNGSDYSTGLGFTVGWIGHFTDCLCNDCLTIGLSFSPETYMRKLDRYEGFFPEHGIDIPAKLRLGLVYQPHQCWLISSDFEYRLYSGVAHLNNNFPSSGTDMPNYFGTKDGPGLGWKDEWMAKVGVQYTYGCWEFRLGYRYEKLPYREDSTNTFLNVLTHKAVEHIGTFGFTWNWDYYTSLTFYGEYGVPKKPHVGIPQINNIGGNPNNDLPAGNAILSERYFTAGLSWGRKF